MIKEEEETLLHESTLSIDKSLPILIHQCHPLIKFLFRLDFIWEVLLQERNQIRVDISYGN